MGECSEGRQTLAIFYGFMGMNYRVTSSFQMILCSLISASESRLEYISFLHRKMLARSRGDESTQLVVREMFVSWLCI